MTHDDDSSRLMDSLEAALEAEHAARLRAESERDRLIEGCVQSAWRNPTAYVEGGHGFEWRYGNSSGFFYGKSDAIAAVRNAAGLEATR